MTLAGRSVLVTGAAGRLGSRLVGELLAEGASVLAFDDGSTGDFARLAAYEGEITLERGDVRDPAALERACQGREVVFHLAARETGPVLELHGVNAEGSLRVLEAARRAGAARVVVASRESAAAPHEAVTLQQRCAERYAALYRRLYGLPTAALRYDPAPGSGGGAEAGREAPATQSAALPIDEVVRLTRLAGDPDRALPEPWDEAALRRESSTSPKASPLPGAAPPSASAPSKESSKSSKGRAG